MKQLFFTSLIILCNNFFSLAQQVPQHKGQWVVDNADMLSEQTENTITALLRTHQDSTSNQVVVLTILSLEGGSLEEFANRVFNTWKIGQGGRNNGVLLLIAKEDRKVRIEVGYGLEGYLTDLESADIIDHVIVPEFKKGNFDQGVLLGVQAILDAIAGTYKPKNKNESSNDDLIFMIFVMVILFIFSYSFSIVKGLAGLGCSISFLLPILLFSIYVIPHPFNWIIFALLIGIFLYRRIFSKKIDLSRSKSTRGWGGGSWGGGGWSSGGGSSWGGGGFFGGGGSSGGGGASGGW